MRLSDRKKIVVWLAEQITKLEGLPHYGEIKDGIERLKKTKEEQERIISLEENYPL